MYLVFFFLLQIDTSQMINTSRALKIIASGKVLVCFLALLCTGANYTAAENFNRYIQHGALFTWQVTSLS